ncbi:hypothetical protein NHJ6243_008787 [Beauveria neobassiana]
MLAKLASLLEVSSLADTLGEKLATALANELQASFTDQNEKLIKDFVLREDDILQPLVNMLVSSVYGAEIANRVSLQARKVLATKNHSEVKRSMEQEFHRISSGRYSWLKELQKLRISNDDMAGLLLDEHEACPWFGPETVHSVDEATAWEQLLATKVDVLLKGDDDVRLKDQKHQRLLKQKVEEMFDNLFHSGMNADRTLRVAWPSREDRHAYSPVPCNGTNAWAKLLSDSTHISSYAYIAPHCLQAGRGSACQSGWEPATGLSQVRAFATRVQCVNAVKSVAELPHESICFFQLMRIIVFAQVHHPDGEPVLLRVILHTVRASVVRRVIAIWHRTGTTITQVQESRDGATRAEEVLIVCGWDA